MQVKEFLAAPRSAPLSPGKCQALLDVVLKETRPHLDDPHSPSSMQDRLDRGDEITDEMISCAIGLQTRIDAGILSKCGKLLSAEQMTCLHTYLSRRRDSARSSMTMGKLFYWHLKQEKKTPRMGMGGTPTAPR